MAPASQDRRHCENESYEGMIKMTFDEASWEYLHKLVRRIGTMMLFD